MYASHTVFPNKKAGHKSCLCFSDGGDSLLQSEIPFVVSQHNAVVDVITLHSASRLLSILYNVLYEIIYLQQLFLKEYTQKFSANATCLEFDVASLVPY